MVEKLKEAIMATDAEVILLDIDGTIKDLVKEHQTALRITVNGFNRGKNLRRKLVFFLDKVAMGFVKSGILSTNRDRQEFLLGLYAIILGKSVSEFRNLYDTFYNDKVIVFRGIRELFEEVASKKKLCFVTVNAQNLNIEKLGIKREDIYCVQSKKKIYAYKTALMMNDLDPEDVLVVGDNIFDDIKPAKKLHCRCLLIDNYKSKFKRFLAKLFKVGIV
ncbi:MAG: HAD family hydrolase [Clostridia bacterium]|nr:HAD family hydrolase [Clostridia bacterium]